MWWIAVTATFASDPSGRWALTPTDSELAALHATAVEEGLSKLPWGFRPFARPQLVGAVKNCRSLELAAANGTLTATCDGARDHVFTTSAPTTVTGIDGKTYTATLSDAGGEWALRFAGADGGQIVVYQPKDDGTLDVRKEIFSEWMTEPFQWSVSYQPDR